VQKQQPNVARRLQQLRIARDNDSVLELPMGTFCRNPFPCPYVARCRREAPPLPLLRLPDLSRAQEIELHKEGIEDLSELQPDREGLTFRQRRTLACIQQRQRLVEPFVREELRETERPLHFLSIALVTDALPQFDLQRPWQRTPYAWAVRTIHANGREEIASFAQLDREDPRPEFVRSLADHLEVGGTIICWDDEPIREMRTLLDSIPGEKASVRTLLAQEYVDMMKLFEAGVFDPGLDDYKRLAEVVAALLDDRSGRDISALDPDHRFEMLSRARAPRVRSSTREKLAEELLTALDWQAAQLVRLFETFAETELRTPAKAHTARARPARPLPKLPE
ncbi:MAG TPA: DUF2779 domain-containing protein, partial [bacterium]|nr:DUF2779 domain-containing protein [bacterium]